MSHNPWVQELLGWHGHEKAGVKVPFDPSRGNPLGTRIETAVLGRLANAAQALATGQAGAPRWIFLVGGPGNGKSEAVEKFVTELDRGLGAGGSVSAAVQSNFLVGESLLTRKVEILPDHVGGATTSFAQRIGRLVIVQDASASDNPAGRGAEELLREVEELWTTPSQPPPVFICCSNRGLLSSALQEVRRQTGYQNVSTILDGIVKATAPSRQAGAGERPSCWPLEADPRFACWPMDLESLLLAADGTSTFRKILEDATRADRWNAAGQCGDCPSRDLCPFLQNRDFLGTEDGARATIAALRHGELATGRRWNFREAFSLVADLLVGCRGDFPGQHPCDWVHARASGAGPEPSGRPEEATALTELTRRLHHRAMFPRMRHQEIERNIPQATNRTGTEVTGALLVAEAEADAASHHVREILRAGYSPVLDPSLETPESDAAGLGEIENHYNHSASAGLLYAGPRLRHLETRLLECYAKAEGEWEAMARSSGTNLGLRRLLRQEACAFAKRAIAVRAGRVARAAAIDDYASTLRDTQKLRRLGRELLALFGKENKFEASLVESFGQPSREGGLRLVAPTPNYRPYPAPSPEAQRPGHDLPYLDLPDARTALPVTFDLFFAIKLREKGCANSCLPASTRAAIDRARQLFAGAKCRDTAGIAGAQVTVGVFDAGELQLDERNQPIYEPHGHGN